MEATRYEDPEYFNKPYFCNTKINFGNPPQVAYAAADTETHQYLHGKQLTEQEGYELMRDQGQQYCKENLEVKVWCYLLYFETEGKRVFLILSDLEDFLRACAMLRVGVVIWYNAKFDFSFFDYYCLTNGWKCSDEAIEQQRHYGHLPHGTYSSLHNDRGQRYKYSLWQEYINKNNDRKVHRIDMVDLMNVLPGGLKGNLESWDVRDPEGNPIRKLTMDYVNDDIQKAYDYLRNDTEGLYYLATKFNAEMKALADLDYLKGDYMTSGGVSKQTMLRRMYNRPYKECFKAFQSDFPMSESRDSYLRGEHIYQGGKTLVNPRFQGKIVSGVYKLDVNSMYPFIMHDMLLPYGAPAKRDTYRKKEGYVQVIHMRAMCGRVKPNMIGVWYDLEGKEYTEVINEEEPFFIFADEYEELLNWYDITPVIDFVWEFKGVQNVGLRQLIDELYEIKTTSKGAKKLCVKIILNAMYGKLAEKVVKPAAHYEMSEGGYVHLIKDAPTIDSKHIMNVIIGSEITSLARTHLMKKIREVTNDDPYDNFVYCDTDSIHAFTHNTETDGKKLGALKIESEDGGAFDKALYLAPKTYIMVHPNYYDRGTRSSESLVVHCKGVSTETMKEMLSSCETIEEMAEIFRPNYPVKCLTALNVIGGKALVYKDKFVLRTEICAGENLDYYDENLKDTEV